MKGNATRLMVLGTGSGVGKSTIVSGLSRLLSRRGRDVVPFKAQNMSNNSEIAREGGELAMSQAVQSRACGKEPSVHFNPILLKPTATGRSEVLVHGEPVGSWEWEEYRARHERMKRKVMQSYERLRDAHETVLMEGAGSPAEPNLMDRDLVNMPMAERSDAPVILVGDISKGGVFAWLTGTLEWLSESQRERVKGFVINKFRGDPSVLDSAIEKLNRKTGIPTLGVIPHQDQLGLSSEDSMQIENLESDSDRSNDVNIGMVRLPKVSNFTDFEPLSRHPAVSFRVVECPENLMNQDLIILPGTKNTIADREWLRRNKFDQAIRNQVEKGASLLGVCGGYQMLGETIVDQQALESTTSSTEGFGYFPFTVQFRNPKLTRRVTVRTAYADQPVKGYEIRYGRLESQTGEPWLRTVENEIVGRQDGSVFGTTIHGLFKDRNFSGGFLETVTGRSINETEQSKKHDSFDRSADLLEEHLHMDRLLGVLENSRTYSGVRS